MPFYSATQTKLDNHHRLHTTFQENIPLRRYCSYCNPIFETQISDNFHRFWNWFRTSYQAINYNSYTVFAFGHLDADLTAGTSEYSKRIVDSTEFHNLDTEKNEI